MMEHVIGYVRLIWLFSGIITLLMLSLCYLYLAMRRAQKQEEESFEFSQLLIEGQERERRRIARELHDGVLPLVQNTDAFDAIRSICMDIMPPNFAILSLEASLSDLCTHFSLRSGIECLCEIEDDIDFSMVNPEDQLHIYRMVQESLTNIEKHSGAKKAVLVVRQVSHEQNNTEEDRTSSAEHFLICISDDGVGLKSGDITSFVHERTIGLQSFGLGMKNMRQRAVILGAKLDFISESGSGLMVRIEAAMNKPCVFTHDKYLNM
jgi:signal transduction histidine kinase